MGSCINKSDSRTWNIQALPPSPEIEPYVQSTVLLLPFSQFQSVLSFREHYSRQNINTQTESGQSAIAEHIIVATQPVAQICRQSIGAEHCRSKIVLGLTLLVSLARKVERSGTSASKRVPSSVIEVPSMPSKVTSKASFFSGYCEEIKSIVTLSSVVLSL